MPHVSAAEGLKITLFVFAVLGTARMVALAHPDSNFAQALLLLY